MPPSQLKAFTGEYEEVLIHAFEDAKSSSYFHLLRRKAAYWVKVGHQDLIHNHESFAAIIDEYWHTMECALSKPQAYAVSVCHALQQCQSDHWCCPNQSAARAVRYVKRL